MCSAIDPTLVGFPYLPRLARMDLDRNEDAFFHRPHDPILALPVLSIMEFGAIRTRYPSDPGFLWRMDSLMSA